MFQYVIQHVEKIPNPILTYLTCKLRRKGSLIVINRCSFDKFEHVQASTSSFDSQSTH